MSLDCVLAAEGADVSRVLGLFHLLDLLSERGTVSKQDEKCKFMIFDTELINSSLRSFKDRFVRYHTLYRTCRSRRPLED
jgi:hypothetical protein